MAVKQCSRQAVFNTTAMTRSLKSGWRRLILPLWRRGGAIAPPWFPCHWTFAVGISPSYKRFYLDLWSILNKLTVTDIVEVLTSLENTAATSSGILCIDQVSRSAFCRNGDGKFGVYGLNIGSWFRLVLFSNSYVQPSAPPSAKRGWGRSWRLHMTYIEMIIANGWKIE